MMMTGTMSRTMGTMLWAMRRSGPARRGAVVGPLVVAMVLAACSGDDPTGAPVESAPAPVTDVPASEPANEGVTIATRDGDLGTILVTEDGMTLYLFTADAPGVSSCTGTCLDAWPALTTDGAPIATAAADASLLGTLLREDGTVQVTYAGRPLYLFTGDASAGEANGQGVNAAWFVVAPDGSIVPSAAGDMADSDAGTGSGGGTGSSGGGGYED